MPDVVPSEILYGQILQIVDEIKEAQGSVDTLGLIQDLNQALARFDEIVGHPISLYEPITPTEPPASEKMNRFLTNSERDIGLLRRQLDLLRSASIFLHNASTTEISNLKDGNAKLGNQLKSLQLHSGSRHDGIIVFADSFRNRDMLDDSRVPAAQRAIILAPSHVALPPEGESIDLSSLAKAEILSSSNGFLGNNQEIEDPETAPLNLSSSTKQYEFVQEEYKADELEDVLDGEPDTWIEYEHYKLTDAQRLQARNYNFVYTDEEDDGNVRDIEWSNGPDGDVLRLDLEFDLKSTRQMNSISLTPFGLENNINYPILVRSIHTSADKTDWQEVTPMGVWIANEVNLQAARTANGSIIGGAVWSFESRPVQYIRCKIEQHNPVDVNVGHLYWVDEDSEDLRVEGPNPPIDDTGIYLSTRRVGTALQRREFFKGKRWAIGIRDIEFRQSQYSEKAAIVTKPMRVSGRVDRVVLESAIVDIPEGYPADQYWVRFFVSPDDGESWHPIARMDNPQLGLPQQISFNDPLHESLREYTVTNYITNNPVTSLRLKIELERPTSMRETTPVLRSYTLKVLKQ